MRLPNGVVRRLKVKRQAQAPQKVIKYGSFVIFESYLTFSAERSTKKAFLEGAVVSLTLIGQKMTKTKVLLETGIWQPSGAKG